MDAAVGDRITIESNRVGGGTRSGQIVEVIGEGPSRHFRVRWDDGHETVFFPTGSAATIEHGSGR